MRLRALCFWHVGCSVPWRISEVHAYGYTFELGERRGRDLADNSDCHRTRQEKLITLHQNFYFRTQVSLISRSRRDVVDEVVIIPLEAAA